MKKFVRIVSLSVALCLCCCFSTFGNVKASAAESFYNTITPPELANLNANLGSGNVLSSDGLNAQSLYEFGNTTTYTASSINFIYPDSWNLDFNPDLYDYYVTLIFDSYSGTFAPNFIRLTSYTASGSANHNLTDVVIDSISGRGNGNVLNGYHIIGKIPESFNGNFRSVYVSGTSGTIGKYLCAYISITQVNKGTETDVAQSIISAINNQTTTLMGGINSASSAIQGSVGQAADDIQQSIEDQYQMEDGEDFGFSDIQEQYEEKMGVLTFGTETTLQMLDLFSPSNAGEAYIRVPGWSMDIQGETYNVWNEYTFYFSWIEDWIPLLVRLMRTFNVTMFYIAILMYINKVYERNFLAK